MRASSVRAKICGWAARRSLFVSAGRMAAARRNRIRRTLLGYGETGLADVAAEQDADRDGHFELEVCGDIDGLVCRGVDVGVAFPGVAVLFRLEVEVATRTKS